jgi:hypothetical protein
MIPSDISPRDILLAAKELDRTGVPPKRQSSKYVVHVNGQPLVYPPIRRHLTFYDASVRDQYCFSTCSGVL